MTVLRRLCAVPAAAVVALVVAAPAAAIVPPADGAYTLNEAGVPPAVWTMQSSCIQPNGTRAQSDYSDETIQSLGCVLQLSSAAPSKATREERVLNFTVRAGLVSDLWAFKVENPEGMQCPDGSTAPTTDNYAFDSATNAGTHTKIHGAVCGGQAGMVKTPFTLSFIAPLQPAVIDRFPDQCNYLAGRPSLCS